MINPVLFYPQAKRFATLQLANSARCELYISTISGTVTFDWGDGTTTTVDPVKNQLADSDNYFNLTKVTKVYSVNYTGVVKISAINGLSDICSIAFADWVASNTTYYLTATHFVLTPAFLKQFPALKAFMVSAYFYQAATVDTGVSMIGDWSDVPDYLEKLSILDVNTITSKRPTINFNNFRASSKLWYLHTGLSASAAAPLTSGSFNSVPPLLVNIRIWATSGALSYTAGKVWPNNFQRFITNTLALGSSSNNSLFLIDIDNSVSVFQPPRLLQFTARTTASNAAVTSIQAKGATVTIA